MLNPIEAGHSKHITNQPFRSISELRHDLPNRSARTVFRLLDKISHGSLHITLPDGSQTHCGHGEPFAALHIHDWQMCEAILKRGDIGLAESYMAGEWQTDDLVGLLNILILNRNALEAAVYGTWWGSAFYRVKHWWQGNTRAQARKNIQAHYDLGNDFYALWLDPSMTYSSALNVNDAVDLQTAQHAKYQRILDELQLPEHARMLEIGFGWGGLAERATEQGVHVTGLTLSVEQKQYAEQRLANQGRSAQVDFRLQDYRDLSSEFHGIASIEMFEAVGEAYWATYFETLARNLKSGGRACVQSITIRDDLFERYRRSTDFIQQYIFPGGMLPSPSIFRQYATKAGLTIVNEHAFGQDYAKTLNAWRTAFVAHQEAVKAQGFDERFMRMWVFYLAYCESAFLHHNTDVYQFTLLKK